MLLLTLRRPTDIFCFATYCCCLLLFTAAASSQTFTPAPENTQLLANFTQQAEQHYKQELAGLTGDYKKDLEEIYHERWSNVKEKFDKREVYTALPAQQYLDKLVAEIVKGNPLLQKDAFNCYFSRSYIPNASYMGEGVILLNMGLFYRLENESQVAFVLCHEIAHFYLNHSEKGIQKYVVDMNSPAVQEKLRKIKSAQYNKREALETLIKGISFDSRRHSRDHESEADSMAVELMHRTRFDVTEALTALALLDTIDTDALQTETCLRQLFDHKDYPFQNRWVRKEEGLLGGHFSAKEDETLNDSLKTHPDCKTRLKALNGLVAKYQSANGQKDIIDRATFDKLATDFRYEIIEYAYERDNYTRSLYYAVEQLLSHPADPYLVTHVGKIMNGLYAAQVKHTLSKVTVMPGPKFPANYNLLLQFIQNLYKEDYSSISYHFLNSYYSALNSYPDFKKEYSTSIQIAKQ